MLKRFLETGQIVNTHGLKGEVNVLPWSDSPESLKDFEGFYFDAEGKAFKKVTSARVHKNLLIMKFEGVDDVDAAAKLVRRVIYLDRSWIDLPEGSYFEQDLFGLSVEDAESGRVYGVLKEVGHTGANDIYRVDGEGGKATWIPAIKQVVRSVDLKGGRMLVTPIKGLFDDAD